MKIIGSKEIKKKYLEFFEEKKHTLIKSSSLVPHGDDSVLFTTAGMQPLTPYLMGKIHPSGKRLVNSQKCLRTNDIDEVGDSSHCTFFQMLGNWSLGDYFKEESIQFSFELLTSQKGLNIPIEKLNISVFKGNNNIEKDSQSYQKWVDLGINPKKIFFLDEKHNWWGPTGEVGPCGPDTEIFYDTGKPKCNKNCDVSCDCGKYVEIWNNVFMEYYKEKDGSFTKLTQKNVDTGMGLERIDMVLNGYKSVYEGDTFSLIIDKIKQLTNKDYDSNIKSFRIVADHLRAACFIIADENTTLPSNIGRGYVLRRLIRRSIRHMKILGIEVNKIDEIISTISSVFIDDFEELKLKEQEIIKVINQEALSFSKTIEQGVREFNKMTNNIRNNEISGSIAFKLFDTYGFPLELTIEMAKEKGLIVDTNDYYERFKNHQEISKQGLEKKFKGGLVDSDEESIKLHTTTHILHKALKEILGENVNQKGSNITSERLRFDFSFDRKLSEEEKELIEKRVNEIIKLGLEVKKEELTFNQAKEKGAIGLFEDKYDKEKVYVYSIGDVSCEMCGGPHINNTNELGIFKIVKEEAVASGVRRIKAVLL